MYRGVVFRLAWCGSLAIGLVLGSLAGCAADGGGGSDRDGAVVGDGGTGTGDTGAVDSGPPPPDVGPRDSGGSDAASAGLQCESCTTDADCTGRAFCVELPGG